MLTLQNLKYVVCFIKGNVMNTIEHPHIVVDMVRGPVISGASFPVRSVVTYILQNNLTPYELMCRFPHLTLAEIYDALSYYYDNRRAMQQDMAMHAEAA